MRKSVFIGAALAMALAAGVPSAPAVAKDAPKAEAISDKIRPFLGAANEAITKKDYPTVLAQVDKAEPLAASPYEKFLCGQFRAIAGQSLKDNKNMILGLDAAVDSGYAAPSNATFALLSGQSAYNAGDYSRAINRLQIAQQLGSTEPALASLLADSYYKGHRTAEGLAAVDKIYTADQAAGRATDQDTLARAAQAALSANMPKETSFWMARLVKNYPSTNNWHDLLAIYRDQHTTLGPQALLDTYRLMRATKSFKHGREVEEYASVALDKKGLPGEAKAAFADPSVASITSPMSKGMTEVKNLATTKSTTDHASLRATAATGLSARGNGDGYFSYGEYASALSLYAQAKAKGGVDASSLAMRVGIAKALSGDKAGAKAEFAQVTGEEADIASYWALWVSQAN